MRKKVLISAYACEPDRGSEPGVGWNLVRELSLKNELTVVTRLNNQKVVENFEEAWVKKINWVFIDPPQWLTFWKRKGRGIQLYYILWQFTLRQKVKELMDREEFDLFHHLTFGKYWVPSGLANLGVPMVFGPVGGGEATPPSLAVKLPRKARFAEGARKALKWIIQKSPGVGTLYSSIDVSIAATHQTASALRETGLTAVTVLPQSGIGVDDLPDTQVDSFLVREDEEREETLRLVTACRLIYWKGVDLAVRAVKMARDKGVKVELTILQEGPEKNELEFLVEELKLTESVKFLGRLPSLEDVYATIQSSDALVHPAYHEAFGQSCLESLGLGVPVVCLDWGGPGMIVDEQTGIKVVPSSYDKTVARLARAIEELPSRLREGSISQDLCRERAFNEFSWARLANSIQGIYNDLLK